MIPDGRTPVVVVTGFLGSGKTTLVNAFLKKRAESLVIVNEFGEKAVDHHLLESSEERTVALPNGCLCCRLRGDLEETLVGAAMRRRRGEIAGFDRVIVETSGLADPGPVAQTLFADQALARDFKLGPVVTVVDAADAGSRACAPDIARAQIAAADLIVLSKTDRASDCSPTRTEVEEINPQATVMEARFGDIDPALLESKELGTYPISKKMGTYPILRSASHPSSISSFVIGFEKPVRRELLERFLAVLVDLRGADLLRVKGVVALEDAQPVLVQGVRHVFDRLRPVELPAAGLVFIANDVNQGEVEALWLAMSKLKGRS